ncbi:MAG TPA: methionyl-tRNA formyltransferase [Thermoanaerobaculia bacterium]|nr:methionyl-tRNA formyltransferase [Thermoanaerobaculia bacterium]
MAGRSRTGKVVFFGTPEIAVPPLDALVESGRRPALVVTQTAKPAGRGQGVQEPPVAARARELGIEVAQPATLKEEAFLARLEETAPDVAVVVAYGKIFPPPLLELPRHGCVNLHLSLLPRYRGAAPIQAALLHGDKKTGVTTMRMEEELDAGPILLQEEVPIRLHETAGELAERLAPIGAALLVETLDQLDRGKLKERRQRDESVSYARRIEKSDGRADWALSAEELYNRVRAFDPWPGVSSHFRNRPVKIVWGVPMDWEDAPMGGTGTFLGLRQGRIAVLAGDSTVFGIEELQRPGKKVLRASDFANGERMRVGERFA